MDFLKKHYEKIILSVVLLGVVGALVALPFVIQKDKEEMAAMKDSVINGKPQPLPPLDLTSISNLLDRVQTPYELNFSSTNKLLNPMPWKKNAAGDVIKITTGHEIDAEAAVVTAIKPLYLILSLENVETNVEVRYVIGIERQAALTRAGKSKQTTFASVGEKKPAFTITKVNGNPSAPDELVLKLADTGETAIIAKGKPFKRPDAYTADLKFDPERLTKLNQREGAFLTFGQEHYKIVAIHQNDVVLSAQSNQKKTILHYPR